MNPTDDGWLSIAQCASLACLLEATTPKPGNVHRGADFEDLCFNDFVVSAVAIGPAMESAQQRGVGCAILEAISATRSLVPTNTNLGCILLIAPLAAVPPELPLDQGIRAVLASLTPSDAAQVYQAISIATPGGLGHVEEMDVHDSAPSDLIQAMRHAAERDLVARQYSNGFTDVLNHVVPWLMEGQAEGWSLTTAIIHTHLRLMAEFPDSLIARKCGAGVAQEAAERAKHVLAGGRPGDRSFQRGLTDLDFWLRSDGHRRNPGTSADLIAAGLFAALRERKLISPFQ
ncbi:MAG: triphosphoribosyl-dephospho-CoA synthase [Planctomycetota bacterium]|nr:triphosphoribosyl-dephospho-CoA synthase [Planctomycetota bacterium]